MLDDILDLIADALKDNNRLPYTDGKEALANYSWDKEWGILK